LGESRSNAPHSDSDVEDEYADNTAAIAQEVLLPSGVDSDQYQLNSALNVLE